MFFLLLQPINRITQNQAEIVFIIAIVNGAVIKMLFAKVSQVKY
jgi:hypothetical protein